MRGFLSALVIDLLLSYLENANRCIGNDSDLSFHVFPLKLTVPPCGFHASQKMRKNQ